ncbi:biosynthetic peptidoglycan transglycosylase [Halobacteriovorax sp. RZ-1]|uniref:biosynthetic peptidoglycan transglycosylase n=1 Tax=unclassified Halobacteriovorax TaxID=2639665 RepID=UPI003717767C
MYKLLFNIFPMLIEIKQQVLFVSNIISIYEKQKKSIPRYIQKAVIILEDKRFYSHPGFDLIAIFRSIIYNLYKDQKSGASTIEQQLTRTLTMKKDRTIRRKILEIIVAKQISKKFDKETILNCYIDCAYLGTGLTGCNNASLKIYKKEYHHLNLEESFLIASCLKYPIPKQFQKNWENKVQIRTSYGIHKVQNH